MGLISRFRLASSAKAGRIDKVVELLESGADPNESSSHGVTALMLTAAAGHVDVARVLAEHGARIENQDEKGHTALVYAIRAGQSDVVKALLDLGAKADVEVEEEVSTLDLAREHEDIRTMKLLMAARASKES